MMNQVLEFFLLHKGAYEKETKELIKYMQCVSSPPDSSEGSSMFNHLKGCDDNECIDRIISVCDVELGIISDDSNGYS